MKTRKVIEVKFELIAGGETYYKFFETEKEQINWLYENEIYEFEERIITVMDERGEEGRIA